MDLLAPCRGCLSCLPFFHVSPPSSPRPSTTATTTTTTAAAAGAEAAASNTLVLPDPAECAQSSPEYAPLHGQDLSPFDQKKDPHAPLPPCVDGGSDLKSSVIAENNDKPLSEIIIAPAVSSPSSSITGASPHEDAETEKTTTLPELPFHVPFINDVSFSTSGLMPLQSPMTPAPFGTGYGYPAGQYHSSPHIYPLGNDHSQHYDVPSQQEHGNPHVEHVTSHDGHGPFRYGHDDSDQSSHHGHGPPDKSVAHEASEYTHSADILGVDNADISNSAQDTSPVALETSDSTPGYLGMEAKNEAGNGDAGASINMGGDAALIETYHSEPIVLSGVPDDDESYTFEEDMGHNALHLGRRRRRRDHFKEQFKVISQQIKQGGHHIKEEGNKHLQTIISNMNKQAQQIEQSGSFFMVPRANNN